MSWEFLVLAVILIPILGSFTVPLVGLLSKRLRNAWAVLLGVATTACALALIPTAFSDAPHVFTQAVGFKLDMIFVVDGLSVFVACVSAFVSTLIIIYSLGYIKEYKYQQEYFMMVVLFLGGMMGLVFSANLIFLFLFWEITGICSWRLIGFFRDREIVVKADKAFLMTFGGAVFMLLGIVMVYMRTGTFNLLEMRGFPLRGWEILFITMGIFAKSATLPFHTWLPDAGVAPTPVTALLHAAVLVKIGVYAFARLFNFTFAIPMDWQFCLLVLGLVSAVVSACAALVETNIKRILAYSTVSQIGYIFMGLATFNTIGYAGAILFILMHGIAKAGLFLCAGVIEHGTGTKDISRMGGLLRKMPVTALAFLFCVLSVVGLPPFGGFYSKSMVISGIIESGHTAIASIAVILAVLTAAYLLRVFALVFTGAARDSSIHAHREGTGFMVFIVGLLGVLALGSGLAYGWPMKLVNVAMAQTEGNPAIHILAEAAKLLPHFEWSPIAIPVLLPLVAGLLAFLTPGGFRKFRAGLALLVTAATLFYAVRIFNIPGEVPGAVIAYPALELNLHLSAPVVARLSLVLLVVAQMLMALFLAFLGPDSRRSPESIFYFLFASGIINALALSTHATHTLLFGEILFVALYSVVALFSLPPGLRVWADSRIAGTARAGLLQTVKGFARTVFVLVDRQIDNLYEKALVGAGRTITGTLSVMHNGLYGNYLAWVVGGFAILAWVLVKVSW